MNEQPQRVIIRATMIVAFALAAVAANSALASQNGGPPPTPLACGATFKTSTIRTSFSLPLSVALPPHWCAVAGGAPGTFGLIHVGTPVGDDSQWWGPDVMLVNGARVHRPSDAVSSKPAAADSTKFVPWPANFFHHRRPARHPDLRRNPADAPTPLDEERLHLAWRRSDRR